LLFLKSTLTLLLVIPPHLPRAHMSYSHYDQQNKRIGTADVRQVDHLRKLSERNRRRRLAEEKNLTNHYHDLKRREEGFNTYMSGANRHDEDVVKRSKQPRVSTAPSSRQKSLSIRRKDQYERHSSAGRQRNNQQHHQYRQPQQQQQRRGWKKRQSFEKDNCNSVISCASGDDEWIPPLVPSPSPTRTSKTTSTRKKRKNGEEQCLEEYSTSPRAEVVLEEYGMKDSGQDDDDYENDSYGEDSFEVVEEEEPDTPESNDTARSILSEDEKTPVADYNDYSSEESSRSKRNGSSSRKEGRGQSHVSILQHLTFRQIYFYHQL
jgi:hypothetical protein